MSQPEKRIKEELARWSEETLNPVIDRFPERKDKFQTSSGIPIERLNLPIGDREGSYLEQMGFPGFERSRDFQSDWLRVDPFAVR